MAFQKRGPLEKVFFSRKAPFLEILENLEILQMLESPQTAENKGKSDHFLKLLEIAEAKRPLSTDSRESPDCGKQRRIRPFLKRF